ncbi:hypothetical protein H9L13_00160 [Sphingomonas lutea]|uniref:Uncharacterized protein n=1 Tax=Sphingomonas lutea TaxID=1045317 RepID=A0A7G9SHV5_9SPHN|nr:hypothetical protein [Sphingomonas lutea]QNN67430.1 hypothetical protein H9L13_00160 [Sphingomonas lutea]
MKPLPALLIVSVAVALAKPACAEPATPTLEACKAARFAPNGKTPNLQGQWDFLMQVGKASSPGVIAIGPMDGAYTGSLHPYRTNTVVIRRLTLDGDGAVRMSVATREGEIGFRGQLTGGPDTICGSGLYHGGVDYQLVAVRRPTSYVPR